MKRFTVTNIEKPNEYFVVNDEEHTMLIDDDLIHYNGVSWVYMECEGLTSKLDIFSVVIGKN